MRYLDGISHPLRENVTMFSMRIAPSIRPHAPREVPPGHPRHHDRSTPQPDTSACVLAAPGTVVGVVKRVSVELVGGQR